jgi:hypothetical protein
MDWDKLCGKLQTQNWIFLLVLGTTSFLLMSPQFTLGVVLGGLLIIANFNVLQLTIRRGFSPNGTLRTNKIAIVAKYYFRLAILAAIIYMLITNAWVHPVGLCVGLSVVVISIVSIGIRTAWKMSSGEAV